MNQLEKKRIIEALEHVKTRSGMYFANDMMPVEVFFAGFSLAVNILCQTAPLDPDETHTNWKKLGFESNRSLYLQLEERGFKEENAIKEYLLLMIQYYQKFQEFSVRDD